MSANLVLRLRLVIGFVVLSACIGCDQVTKGMATSLLQNAEPVSFFADTLRFEYALNPGGFLSLGGGMTDGLRQSIFVGVNSCVMLAMFGYLCAKRWLSAGTFVSLAFILGGGIGNLIDRVWNSGLVTDFINVGVGPVRTGIFNIAVSGTKSASFDRGCFL